MVKPFYAALPFLGPTTAASVAAAPGPSGLQWVYVDEFDATYRWNLGSAVAVDGYRVLGHTAGQAGRWILDGAKITLSPLGAGLDDWARLAGAWTAMAYMGEVWMNAGAWRCDTEQVIPSGTTLQMTAGVTIASTLVANPPDFTGTVFFNDGGTTAVNLTTVAVDAGTDSSSLQVANAAAIAIGNRIIIRNSVAWATARQVVNKVGNVLTLDRPLLRPFIVGDGVAVIATARDITIRGNGATITGTGDAAMLFSAAWDCEVSGLNLDTTTTYGLVYDIASRDSIIDGCTVDGNLALESAYQIDSAESCDIVDCYSTRPANNNIVMAGSIDCHIMRGIHADAAADNGMLMTILDAGDTIGCRGCTADNVTFVGAGAGSGIRVINNSSDNTFTGCDFSYNQGGVTFTAGASRNAIVGGRARANTQVAVLAQGATALGNRVIGMSCEGHVVGVFQATTGAELEIADLTIDDSAAVNPTQAMVLVSDANTVVRIIGVRAHTARTGGSNSQTFVHVTATAKVFISGNSRYVAVSVNGAAVRVDSGVARISDFVAIVPGSFGLWLNGATGYARIGSNCDFSACGTPFQITAGAMNRGRVALTAAVAVAIAFGDTNATDDFFWSYETNVGATGIVISGAPVVGTGFNIVGIAGDTSFINYEIR